MLDPHVLKSFIAVAELKSFTKAANKVHLTQSTVSQQIKKLEEDLKCSLFSRQGKIASTTLEGEKLLLYARKICHLLEEAEDVVKLDLEYGFLRIGVPEDIASSFIAPVLAGIKKKYSKIQFSVMTGISRKLWEHFERGELDIVFIKQKKGDTTGIASWCEPLVWVDHFRIMNYNKDIIPLVAFSDNGLYRNEMINYLDEMGKRWRVSYESSSLPALTSAISIGFWISLLPGRVVLKDHKILSARQGFRSMVDFELVMHKTAHSSVLMGKVANDLIKAFKNY